MPRGPLRPPAVAPVEGVFLVSLGEPSTYRVKDWSSRVSDLPGDPTQFISLSVFNFQYPGPILGLFFLVHVSFSPQGLRLGEGIAAKPRVGCLTLRDEAQGPSWI